jgi:heme exporter protein D
MDVRAVGGGLSLLVVSAAVGLRSFNRYERNEARREAREAREEGRMGREDPALAASAEFLDQAHMLVDHAPEQQIVGKYLHEAVEQHHNAAFAACGMNSLKYRDAIMAAVLDQCKRDGRQDALKVAENLRLFSGMVGAEWWNLKKRG